MWTATGVLNARAATQGREYACDGIYTISKGLRSISSSFHQNPKWSFSRSQLSSLSIILKQSNHKTDPQPGMDRHRNDTQCFRFGFGFGWSTATAAAATISTQTTPTKNNNVIFKNAYYINIIVGRFAFWPLRR